MGEDSIPGTHSSEAVCTAGSWQQTDSPVMIFQGHHRRVSAIAVSTDGKHLYTGSVDGTARRWETSTGECIMTYENEGHSISCIHHEGKFLWTAGASFNNTIRKWDVRFGKQLNIIEKSAGGHRMGVTVLQTDEEHLYSASYDGTVKSWTIGDSQYVNTYQGHEARAKIKAMSVGKDKIATGATDQTVRIFNKATCECNQSIAFDSGVSGVLLVGEFVFVGTKAAKGYKYCAKTGVQQLEFAQPKDMCEDLGTEHPSSGFKDFSVSAHGGCIVVSNRSSTHLFDSKKCQPLLTVAEESDMDINAVCLVAAGQGAIGSVKCSYLFVGLDNNLVHMYQVVEPAYSILEADDSIEDPSTVVRSSQPTLVAHDAAPTKSSCCVLS